ncbi:MAG: hypothetical protein WCA54_00785 [Pseudolabrys sp.]
MLTAEERAALDAIGDPEIVRLRLLQSGGGPGALIPGFPPVQRGITRSHIEQWLIEKNKAAIALEGSRYRKVLWWTVAAAVAAIIAAWPVVEPWIRSAVPR